MYYRKQIQASSFIQDPDISNIINIRTLIRRMKFDAPYTGSSDPTQFHFITGIIGVYASQGIYARFRCSFIHGDSCIVDVFHLPAGSRDREDKRGSDPISYHTLFQARSRTVGKGCRMRRPLQFVYRAPCDTVRKAMRVEVKDRIIFHLQAPHAAGPLPSCHSRRRHLPPEPDRELLLQS